MSEEKKWCPHGQYLDSRYTDHGCTKCLAARVAELEGAGKLPITDDGREVYPDTKVYHITDGEIRVLPWKDWYAHWNGITKCYSTKAATPTERRDE